MPEFLKKDNYLLGVLLGLILPLFFYGVLYVLDLLVFQLMGAHVVEFPRYLYLLATIINLYPIRVYLVNLKFEKSGKGVLLVSLLEIIAYFLLFYNA